MTPTLRAALLGAAVLSPGAVLAQAPAQCAAPEPGVQPVAVQAPASPMPVRGVFAAPPPTAPPPGLEEVPASALAGLPALGRVADAGAKLYELAPLPGGLRTFFALAGSRFQVFYVPPGGEVAIRGLAQDAAGRNLTLDQTRHIPGVVPTVEIREGAPLVDGSPAKTAAAATHALWGRDDAPRVHVFVDARCGYSTRAIQALRPHVEAGRVQVALVPVAVLDHENGGRSTDAALAMLSVPGEGRAAEWLERWGTWGNGLHAASSEEAERRFRANQQAADAVGLRGTPTFFWARPDGTEGRADGVPADVDAFVAGLGGPSARGG